MGKDVVRVQIVPFDKKDFESCVNIFSSCIDDPRREISEYLENDSVRIFCAKEKGKVLGAVCVLLTADSADILDIATDENFKRQGIGRALCEYVFAFCEKHGVFSVLLEVRESNAPAIALYEKCGFEKIYVRKNYYTNPPENGLIYRREK